MTLPEKDEKARCSQDEEDFPLYSITFLKVRIHGKNFSQILKPASDFLKSVFGVDVISFYF